GTAGDFCHCGRSLFQNWAAVFSPEVNGGPVRRGGPGEPHGVDGELRPGHGASAGGDGNLLPDAAAQHRLFHERSDLMDAVRRYVMTLAAAAMLCALVKAIAPGHKGQEKILSLVCGIF